MKYRFCKFCSGNGCLACPGEYQKEMDKRAEVKAEMSKDDLKLARQFEETLAEQFGIPYHNSYPDKQIEPIAVIRLDDPKEVEIGARLLGGHAISAILDEVNGDKDDFHKRFLENAAEYRKETAPTSD